MELRELETEYNSRKVILTKAKNVVGELSDIRTWTKEAFVVFCLDTRNAVISREIVSIGILNAVYIHAREVYRTAIIRNACSIIIAHNHPGGDVQPSEEDRNITKRLKDSGDLLGITLLDHVIVTDTGFYSFQNMGEV